MVAVTPFERRSKIDAARASAMTSSDCGLVDSLISASWERSRLLDETSGPSTVSESLALTRWAASPVNRYAGAALLEFATQVEAEGFASAFVDVDGLVLWSAASKSVARAAEGSGFLLGSNWSEESVGTNGPGTAIAAGRPVAVFANEHWKSAVQNWACYATPVRNRFGEVIGALDISTDWKHESGLALATVAAMGRVVEQLISVAPVASDSLRVSALGATRANLFGTPIRLSPRQLEIIVILETSGGCSLEELHDRLHGERRVSTNTTKSEISGLRRILGADSIGSRPYRLTIPVDLDVTHLLNALSRLDLETASRLYSGQLLPLSESPDIHDLRHRVDVGLRDGLLASGTPAQIERYLRINPFDTAIEDAARG